MFLQPHSSFSDISTPAIPSKIIYPAQAAYLTNNWRNIQADNEYSEFTKFVRVVGGVANITSGKVLVRYFLDVPDGFYLLREDKGMIMVNPQFPIYSRGFPDVEGVRPNFTLMDRTTPICKQELADFVGFLNYLRTGRVELKSGVRVVMDDTRIVGDAMYAEKFFTFSCDLPVKYGGLIFDANNLRLAFTEMLRYDHVYIGRENRPDYNTPLVVGLDWGHCVIVDAERSL